MAGLTVGTTVPVANTIPSSFVTTHDTDGLAGWGAFDWFRPAGTIVGSPVSGTVYRLSGSGRAAVGMTGGAFGYSMYIQAKNGTKLFLTHFAERFVRAGQHVEIGTPLGRVAKYGNASHIHVGAEGAKPRGATVKLGGPPSRAGALPQVQAGRSAITPGSRGQIGFDPVTGIRIGGAHGSDLIPDPPGFGTITDIAGAFGWISGNWDRVLEVVGGFLITVAGLYLLARQLGAPKASLPSMGGMSDDLERSANIEQRSYESTLARSAGRERAKTTMGENPQPSKPRPRAGAKDFGEVPF